MTDSKIEWTDKVWNPTVGCSVVSPGCDHCYAVPQSRRNAAMGRPEYEGLTVKVDGDGPENRRGSEWTGEVRCLPERLTGPLRWRTPKRVFVNSMSDLFHPAVPPEFIAQAFATMAFCPHLSFQVLTKRPQLMERIVGADDFKEEIWSAMAQVAENRDSPLSNDARAQFRRRERAWVAATSWPLPNVWLGVSVENQTYADLRIPHLLATPAAVRFLSVEPLLGPVSLDGRLDSVATCETCDGRMSVQVDGGGMACPDCFDDRNGQGAHTTRLIDWVIVGGESGPGARPMHPQWARTLRDQCVEAGVPFLFKQYGEWAPGGHPSRESVYVDLQGRLQLPDGDGAVLMARLGKKVAGRELDGRTWDEFP